MEQLQVLLEKKSFNLMNKRNTREPIWTIWMDPDNFIRLVNLAGLIL